MGITTVTKILKSKIIDDFLSAERWYHIDGVLTKIERSIASQQPAGQKDLLRGIMHTFPKKVKAKTEKPVGVFVPFSFGRRARELEKAIKFRNAQKAPIKTNIHPELLNTFEKDLVNKVRSGKALRFYEKQVMEYYLRVLRTSRGRKGTVSPDPDVLIRPLTKAYKKAKEKWLSQKYLDHRVLFTEPVIDPFKALAGKINKKVKLYDPNYQPPPAKPRTPDVSRKEVPQVNPAAKKVTPQEQQVRDIKAAWDYLKVWVGAGVFSIGFFGSVKFIKSLEQPIGAEWQSYISIINEEGPNVINSVTGYTTEDSRFRIVNGKLTRESWICDTPYNGVMSPGCYWGNQKEVPFYLYDLTSIMEQVTNFAFHMMMYDELPGQIALSNLQSKYTPHKGVARA